MRTRNRRATRALLPAIVAATCAIAASIALSPILGLAHARPHIGDIIGFAPSADLPIDQDIHLLVQRPDQYGCVIDLAIIRQAVGSLVVETESGGGEKHFHLHWAGARTSADTGNCGSDADLIVDQQDLDILVLAASS